MVVGAKRKRRGPGNVVIDQTARFGLVAYGIQHLLIAWLAVQVALGDRSEQVSSKGALRELASTGLGQASVFVVAAGFGALVVWQVIEAAVGHRDEDGVKRTAKRLLSAGKAVLYGALGVGAARLAVGAGGGKPTDAWTARLMSAPAGPLLVGAVGAGIVGVAAGLAYRGWTEKHRSNLDSRGTSGRDGRTYVLLGKIGYLSKAAVLLAVGLLFLHAAWTHDPDKSGGLDQALQKLVDQPFGPALLVGVAVGTACYGLFCFAWARHLDR